MKKMIIIEDKDNYKYDKKYQKLLYNIFEWFILMIGYAIVLIVTSNIFTSINISSKYFYLFAFLGAIIIYILNKTIKPILIYLTLPITVLTYGICYPIVNVLILYITNIILGDNFTVTGFFGPFIASIFISLFNIVVDYFIKNKILRRKKHE